LHVTGYFKIFFFMVVLIAITGSAMAAVPPGATKETQGLKTTVGVSVASGAVASSETLVMQVANDAGGVGTPPLEFGQRQAVNAYSEASDFKGGATEYAKTFNADTRNRVLTQYNVVAHRNIQFIAQTNAQNLTGAAETTERIMMDVVGNTSSSAKKIICPFAATSEFVPAFCDIVQAGSTISGVRIGSLITDASERDIQSKADFPAELNYGITAKTVTGSANVFIDVHAQEARGDSLEKEADFVYKESDSANGQIGSFSKSMSYQDGLLRI